MQIGDELVCEDCGEVIRIDESDLDEGDAFCTSCGGWSPLQRDD